MCLDNKKIYETCPVCGSKMIEREEVHDELGTHFYDIKYWECTKPECGHCMTKGGR